MEFDKNSFTAKLVSSFYPDYWLPTSLCTYFWKALFAYVSLPLTWPLVWLFWKDPNNNGNDSVLFKFLGGVVINVVIAVIVYVTITDPYQTLIVGGYILMLATGLTLLAVLTRFLAIKHEKYKWGVEYKHIWFNVGYEGKPRKNNIIVEFFKAKKEKYCPKIEWVDKKED